MVLMIQGYKDMNYMVHFGTLIGTIITYAGIYLQDTCMYNSIETNSSTFVL